MISGGTFDAHVDTLAVLSDSKSFIQGTSNSEKPTHVDAPRAIASGVSDLVMAICSEAEPDSKSALKRMIGIYEDLKESTDLSLHLMLEGCEQYATISSATSGLSAASLTWNGENSLAGGIGSDKGLTAKGTQLAKELYEKGVNLDVSHLCDKSRRDLFHLDFQLIATHCNCRRIFNHPRNLPDDDIREIGIREGVVGITFAAEFLGEKQDMEAVLRHLEHALDLAGTESVGFGSDFDGTLTLPQGIEDCTCWPALISFLKDHGWDQQLINGVTGDNWRRIFQTPGKDR